ncbi:MAG: hypothetical protein JNM89_03070 [Hyphomicrobiaceae bacterium]|nr:hypothetical protein [Hyphomicrobiaceae bacterium]
MSEHRIGRRIDARIAAKDIATRRCQAAHRIGVDTIHEYEALIDTVGRIECRAARIAFEGDKADGVRIVFGESARAARDIAKSAIRSAVPLRIDKIDQGAKLAGVAKVRKVQIPDEHEALHQASSWTIALHYRGCVKRRICDFSLAQSATRPKQKAAFEGGLSQTLILVEPVAQGWLISLSCRGSCAACGSGSGA